VSDVDAAVGAAAEAAPTFAPTRLETLPDKPDVALPYTPGFDGLRALGLLVILGYHHGIGAARGGIFTVSMFFTLSGYLIATLTLAEWTRADRVSIGRFWERRARRLLPAALLTVAVVVALQSAFEVGSGARFRGDLLGALGYAANWRFAFSGGDYGAIFQIEAPVQHFWSLAVEEQFYVLFPLLFVGLMRLTRDRWRMVGAVFGGAAAASFVAAWLTAAAEGSNSGLAYYATYTRGSEILVGVALAFAVVTRPAQRVLSGPVGIRAVRWGGLAGLVGLAWLWHSIDLGNPVVFRGGTLLNATCTSLVILACRSAAPGRVARGLGIWPLRSLGKISYGVYLFHWPLFLLLDERRTGLGYHALFGVRVGATIGLAVLSYHLLEMPFRQRLKVTRPQLGGVLAGVAALVVVLVVVVPVHPARTQELKEPYGDFDPARDAVVFARGGIPPVARVLLIGDSVSWTMWAGLDSWNHEHTDQQLEVDAVMAMGCTLGEPDTNTRIIDEAKPPTLGCRKLRQRVADMVAFNPYDAVVVEMGHMDLGERLLDGRWRHLGDDTFDDWFRGQVGVMADTVAVEGVPVLWDSAAHVRAHRDDPGSRWQSFDDNDPQRVDRLNEIVADELAGRPGFQIADVGGWLRRRPGGEFDPDLREDGMHYTFDGSDAVAAWLVPQILDTIARSPAGQ
jgi:peptidoglycan/LPS O-acetylase OafA/YrhL